MVAEEEPQHQMASSSSTPEGQSPSSSSPDREQRAPPGRLLDYEALFEQIKGKPIRVAAVDKLPEEEGRPMRTKQSIIDRELQRVYDAKTLEELHAAMEQAGRNLQQLNVFNKVDFLANEEPEDDPEAVTVLVDLQEKNWYKVHAATYVQGGESTVEGGVSLCNATGNAEHVSLSAEYGTESSSQFALAYEQPRIGGLPATLDARVHQYLRNYQKASSFTETMRGGVVALKSMNGVHTLQYELGWRQLADTSRSASRAVLAQTGDYLKAAARYTLLLDRRRHGGPAPTSGWAVRSSTELAGLPGQDDGAPSTSGRGAASQWVKQQVDAQVLMPLIRGATLSLTATAGLMLPWGGSSPLSRPTVIAERFFLGGPSTLRGFEFKGAGPTDVRRPSVTSGTASAAAASVPAGAPPKRDALGGDAYASLMAAVTFPLPAKALQALRIHGHVFVNGGNCLQVSGTGRSLAECARDFGSTFRWTAGAGFVLPSWFGRFEVNYVHVLAAQEHDRVVKNGLQLGFASSIFL